MTKLQQWLLGLSLFVGLWIAAITETVPIPAVYLQIVWLVSHVFMLRLQLDCGNVKSACSLLNEKLFGTY